ncbi:MAG: CheR family methyltransferase [bacterium]
MKTPPLDWFDLLTKAVRQRAGWRIPEKDYPKLAKAVSERMAVHHLDRYEDYVALLQVDGKDDHSEWRELVNRLTVQESYFFRDKGQFALLQERILPELIHRNEARRSLRIWSAGCSTGEEPYSIAILLDDLLAPRNEDWKVSILGTDINDDALLKARRAIYATWAFRGVSPGIQARFFTPLRQEWQLNQRIRARVQFQPGNLYMDPFPNPLKGLHDFDLILCRNVFIYLHTDAVASILRKFAGCLSKGGYLLTAHTELQGVPMEGLTARVFPGSVIYQHQVDYPAGSIKMELSPHPTATVFASHRRIPTRQVARIQSPPETLSLPAKALEGETHAPGDLLLTARIYANQGRYEEASKTAQQAAGIDATAGPAYFLLAQIAAHQGNLEGAREMCMKTIYLEPRNVAAYLELAFLCEQQNHQRRAGKMCAVALDLLAAMPPEQTVEHYEPATAGELVAFVKRMLSELDKKLHKV